ncbi:hypothetical protein BC835DRAFT_309606 [Cytidiella melzeri]|nr:hypothetical protein BC835DRAFT_309606 [Cytidiella melzeri]
MPTPSPPQTSITFTAEWDLTEKSFVFTPFDASCPLAPTTTHFTLESSPIPLNVDEDYSPYSPALSTPSVYSMSISSPHHPGLSTIQTTWEKKTAASSMTSRSASSPDSANSPPSTPVSPIFDDESLYSHGRKLSQSTVASSVAELSEDECADASQKDDIDQFIAQLNSSKIPSVSADDRNVDSDLNPRPEQLTPLSALEQILYRTPATEPSPLWHPASADPIKKPSRARRPLPDVPISAKSTYSIYSPDSKSRFSPVSPLTSAWPVRNSLRHQLQTQIRNTFFGGRLPRN